MCRRGKWYVGMMCRRNKGNWTTGSGMREFLSELNILDRNGKKAAVSFGVSPVLSMHCHNHILLLVRRPMKGKSVYCKVFVFR